MVNSKFRGATRITFILVALLCTPSGFIFCTWWLKSPLSWLFSSAILTYMPPDHQKYLEWNGERFKQWAERIGPHTHQVIIAILSSSRVEQQTYKSCMGLLKLAERHSESHLEAACQKALSYTGSPSYKSIKNILATGMKEISKPQTEKTTKNTYGVTRGANYYGEKYNDK